MENMDIMINELIAEVEKMDPEILAGGIVFLAGLFAVIVAYNVIRYLMKGIGYSAMYRKAGVAPWKAFIPVYNIYNNYKLSWNGKFFFLSAALYILLNVLMGAEALAVQLVAAAAGIALLVVDMKQNIKMAKRFGKGNGTGVALFFFPGIASLILGLGTAEFQGEMIKNN